MSTLDDNEVRRPIPANVTKAQIHAFAERVASQLGVGPRHPIGPLITRLGGRIEYRVQATERLPESIIVEAPNKFTIFLPNSTSQERDRFTVAHELGHLFVHYPKVAKLYPGAVMAATRWVNEQDPEQQRAEWEANWFAAAFLMPSDAFRECYQNNGSNLAMTAMHFGVSKPAAEVRLKTVFA